MKVTLMLAISLGLSFYSCNRQGSPSSDDKPESGGILPTSTQLITRMWQVSEWTAEGLDQLVREPSQAIAIENAMQLLYDLQVDDQLIIWDRQHEYVADGSWVLAQDTTELRVEVNENARILQIRHFSHDHLQLHWLEPVSDEIAIPITLHLKPYRRTD